MESKNVIDISEIGEEVEAIVDSSENLNELQSHLILLVQKYLAKKNKNSSSVKNTKEKTVDEKVTLELTKFTSDLIKKYQDIDQDIDKNQSEDHNYPLDKKAKLTIKKLIKEFTIYEIYKVMNPKRIAGETKKDNFAHNMVMGGHKKAGKYEGGKKSDLKSYGTAEVKNIERASKIFRSRGGFEL